MVDVNHYYGGDLSASATGDLSLADLPTTGLQRVYRRLLTNPQLADVAGNIVASADYMSHIDYGAGLPRKVGSPQNVPVTEALIKGQMFLESAVTRNPLPKITLTPITNGLSSVIQYQDANTATPQFLEFDINK
jgi:hypothetical protein